MNKLETRIEICKKQCRESILLGNLSAAMCAFAEMFEHMEALKEKENKISAYLSKRDQRYGRAWIGAD